MEVRFRVNVDQDGKCAESGSFNVSSIHDIKGRAEGLYQKYREMWDISDIDIVFESAGYVVARYCVTADGGHSFCLSPFIADTDGGVRFRVCLVGVEECLYLTDTQLSGVMKNNKYPVGIYSG